MNLTTPDKQDLRQIKKLYRTAFPRIERKPFRLILRQCKKGEAELFAVRTDSGRFAGFAVTVMFGDIVMLDYFAIHPKLRGRGIGSRVLKMLMSKYADRRFILEIESVSSPCRNLVIRQKRREFYLKNGMKTAGFTAHVFFTDLEVLTAGMPVSFDEYRELYAAHLGRRANKKI
ncbi:MAG: GNAT family N-acetyltransferase, partial [Oscillospiraceae bacterium]|nr:GNAT family N-acetyltransferase [Oscillospiraceae bacterium]